MILNIGMAFNRLDHHVDDSLTCDSRIVCRERHLAYFTRPSDVGIELSQITVLRSIRSITDVIQAVLGEKHFDEMQYPDDLPIGIPLN